MAAPGCHNFSKKTATQVSSVFFFRAWHWGIRLIRHALFRDSNQYLKKKAQILNEVWIFTVFVHENQILGTVELEGKKNT